MSETTTTTTPAAGNTTTPAAGAANAALNTPPPAVTTPAATTTTPAAADWTTGFNDDLKGYIQNKGFKSPDAVADAYRNLEKLHSAGPDKLLKLPESMESPEARALWERLGAPKAAKDYGLEAIKGADKAQAEFAQAAFHELGVPKAMAEKFFQKMTDFEANKVKTATDARLQEGKTQIDSLKKDWGMAENQNREIALRAAKHLGISGADVEALEQVKGARWAIETLYKIGTGLGEANFISGNPVGDGVQSPEQARQTKKELMKDKSFADKLLSGDADARRKWDNLNKMAAPDIR